MSAKPAYRRKLIEVDLPLEFINKESVREKSLIRHGHPSTLHLWWARRPLAACRAVIFASLVDDPGDCDEFPDAEAQHAERERLHELIRRLVKWENSSDADLLAEARYEIARSVARAKGETAPMEPAAVLDYLNRKVDPIYDPFCGGGSIPLEAQRLGLRAVGSDLNPVAVLITRALIELPPKFANRPPVNPEADRMGMTVGKGKRAEQVPWRGAAGLADDVRYYGRKMREMAWERIGHLYPKAKLPEGGEATVIAWLWARTVPCANPACGVQMPLMRNFQVSKKKGNEHWVKPVVDRAAKTVSFVVQTHLEGVPAAGTVNRNGATCIVCRSAMPLAQVREQARAGNMGEVMTCIVAEGDRRRRFVSPNAEHVYVAYSAVPNTSSIPQQKMPTTAYLVSGRGYGITHWKELFTQRQLAALTTFSSMLADVKSHMLQDEADENYANVVSTYLALAIGRVANSCSRFVRWRNSLHKIEGVFARQAIPMLWDFAESNPFCTATQNWLGQIEWVSEVLEALPKETNEGLACQADATNTMHVEKGPVIVTDPPYYDNISYAELSDYFYVWLRPLLRDIYPDLLASMLVPIAEEMIAAPRFKDAPKRFERLLNQTLCLIREHCSENLPSSIFYAYKQQEQERDGVTSTGWETMLKALFDAGFQVVATWPMRTEQSSRPNALAANSLASSVILVCRPQLEEAPPASRRQFLDELAAELPAALEQLTVEGHIAPVDLAQAAIGPGMKIYSRYRRVETIGGDQVTVREALAAINRAIADYDEAQEGELDPPTRFCLDWVKQHGFREGSYGEAETLARAKNVSVDQLRDTHNLLTAQRGEVQLLPLDAYAPKSQRRLGEPTAWDGAFRIAWHLNTEDGRGVEGASEVCRELGSGADAVERLARILYNHYDRKGDSRNSVMFNNLVTEWQRIQERSREKERGEQGKMPLT